MAALDGRSDVRHDASQSIGHLGGVGTGRGRVVRVRARRRGRLVRDHLFVRDGSRVGGRRGEESARRPGAGVYAAGVAAASPPGTADASAAVLGAKVLARRTLSATSSRVRRPAASISPRARDVLRTRVLRRILESEPFEVHDEHPRQSNDAPGERRAYPLAPVTLAPSLERFRREESSEERVERRGRLPGGKVHGEVPERLESLRDVAARVARQRRANRGGEVTTRRAQRSMQRNRTGGTTGDGTAECRRWRRGAESVGCGGAVSPTPYA